MSMLNYTEIVENAALCSVKSLKLYISGSTKFFTHCCYSLRGAYYPGPKLKSQNLQQGSLGCVFPNIVAIHGENEIFFLPDCFFGFFKENIFHI